MKSVVGSTTSPVGWEGRVEEPVSSSSKGGTVSVGMADGRADGAIVFCANGTEERFVMGKYETSLEGASGVVGDCVGAGWVVGDSDKFFRHELGLEVGLDREFP
jgi:hypothetical protein